MMEPAELELSVASRTSLRSAIGRLSGDAPIIVVAASDKYAIFLDNWLCHMEMLGVGNLLVVAMDDALDTRLVEAGILAARCEFDGSWSDFWYRRFLIWDFLIAEGADIIHSDVDAIWLKNPLQQYFGDKNIDLIWTQGTLHPNDVWSRWGFVLCTGLFGARANMATKKFFAATKSRSEEMLATTDQTIINQVLKDHDTAWATADTSKYDLDWHGTPYTCFDEVVRGRCDDLELRLALLPYHLFPRSEVRDGDGVFVKHLHPPQGGDYRSPEGRVPQMRAAGCWLLDRMPGKLKRQ